MKYISCVEELRKIIRREFGYEIALTSIMAEAINIWSDLMENRVPWQTEYVFGNQIPSTIASEVARLTVLELESKVENEDTVAKIYEKVISKIDEYTEYGLGKGGMILKPFLNGDKIEVSCIQADNFFPIRFDNDEMLTVAFIEQLKRGRDIFTRVEIWDYDDGQLKIVNKAYKTNVNNEERLGNEVELTAVDSWADITPSATFECDKMPFGFFRVPLANVVDAQSPLGISIFHKAIQDIARADRQISEIDWEYEAKETAVHIGDSMLKTNEDGTKVYPKGGSRLYRTLDYYSGAVDKPLLEVFSPEIRDQSLYNGLQNTYRAIELKSCLSYGTLSNPNNVDKTAEEIKMSKQRSFDIVSRCQRALQDALSDMLDGIMFWGNLNGTIPVKDLQVSFSWGDSVLTDKDKDRQIMLQEVSAGIRTKESYLMEVYGITEDDARSIIPATMSLFADVNTGLS